jgi:type IV pilus assembly protein PilA
MKRFMKQIGQGMTEYIIIVALIAIAAIAAYSLFGDTVRSQVGGMAAELGGQSSTATQAATATAAAGAQTAGIKKTRLKDYTGQSE